MTFIGNHVITSLKVIFTALSYEMSPSVFWNLMSIHFHLVQLSSPLPPPPFPWCGKYEAEERKTIGMQSAPGTGPSLEGAFPKAQ